MSVLAKVRSDKLSAMLGGSGGRVGSRWVDELMGKSLAIEYRASALVDWCEGAVQQHDTTGKNQAFDDDRLRYSYDTGRRLSTTAKQAGRAEARKRVLHMYGACSGREPRGVRARIERV